MGRCYHSIAVNAPIEKVWATIRDFHDLSWAKGVVEKVEAVGSIKGNQVGAQRILNGVFHETLLVLNDDKHVIQYSIDDGPGPVAKDAVKNYVGSVRLCPITADNSTFVEWTSQYDAADDDAVGAFCNPIYQALLKALQAHCRS